MAVTFDYTTEQLERDFKFIGVGNICELRGIKARVGAWACEHCPFNKGIINEFSITSPWLWQDLMNENNFVKCVHKDAEDSEDSSDFKHYFYEYIRDKAIAHYYD